MFFLNGSIVSKVFVGKFHNISSLLFESSAKLAFVKVYPRNIRQSRDQTIRCNMAADGPKMIQVHAKKSTNKLASTIMAEKERATATIANKVNNTSFPVKLP
jgi:hypothetical protein